MRQISRNTRYVTGCIVAAIGALIVAMGPRTSTLIGVVMILWGSNELSLAQSGRSLWERFREGGFPVGPKFDPKPGPNDEQHPK